jgi:hypothetical protein
LRHYGISVSVIKHRAARSNMTNCKPSYLGTIYAGYRLSYPVEQEGARINTNSKQESQDGVQKYKDGAGTS